MVQPVFRFAPSPNGRLHLGHAYSALLNARMAKEVGGRMLVRIEDIDQQRCTKDNIAHALADLRWLGVDFEEPVLHQSERFAAYRDAVVRLMARGLLYVCTCSRKQLATSDHVSDRDPEGQPLYPGTCKRLALPFERMSALRLRMKDAVRQAEAMAGPLAWREKGACVTADSLAWGDVIIARKDVGTSYHLSVVVDDAFQAVTDVVRGEDLMQATSIHRVLQVLLDLPESNYHHHALLRHGTGRKLAKSRGDESLAELRDQGMDAATLRQQLGFE
jgi:glutamyl-Q tRNA(Asp) synthetase